MIPTAFSPLASHLWQSTVFAGVMGLLTLALRRNQARVRCWLWLAASYKFLIPFSWLVSIGHHFEWRGAVTIMQPAFSAVTDAVSGPIFLTSFHAATPAPNHFPAPLLAIWTVWACGFVVVVGGWAREWLRIRTVARAASPLPLRMPIQVVSTPARLEPGVFGILRPVLLLPEGLGGRLTQAQLQAVLAHELCHVRRRDNLAAAVHMLIEALFWFYPLVWWLGARLIDERERACDEEVLRLGGEPEVYAEGILNVCKCYMESPVACVSGISGSDLKKRVVRIMTQRLPGKLTVGRKLLLAAIGIAAVAGPLVFGVLAVPSAQSPAVPDWQTAAGGKMAFDVASVKQDTTAPSQRSNVPLGPMDVFAPTGGLLSATNWPLIQYMIFAYKLTPSQTQAVMSQLPKWANTDRYDIQARASGNPSKDQMRLMMQALLADRFKLAVHTETRRLPVFALVLDKPEKLGPQLQQHPEDSPCSTAPRVPGSAPGPLPTVAGGFPEICSAVAALQPSAPGRVRAGARNVTMGLFVASATGVGNLDRPVVDRTGLTGSFDFVIEFTPQINGPQPPGATFQPDESGPTFLEALKEQLGLKLVPQTGLVDVLVIDQVELPSGN